MKTLLKTALLLAPLLPLHAGDFKRFYAAEHGEVIATVKPLPGDGLVIVSKKNDGSGEVIRALLPERQLAIQLPPGAEAVAASSDFGVIFKVGGRYFRKPVGPLGPLAALGALGGGAVKITEVAAKGFTLTGGDGEAVLTAPEPKWPAALHPCGEATKIPLEISPTGIMLVMEGGHTRLEIEQIEGGKEIIDHGQCGGEYVWTLVSVPRGAILLPARRTVQIYNPADGAKIAKTTVSKDAPRDGIIIPYRSLEPKGPAGLIVITGGSLEWWSPVAKHLDQWGEVIVSPEALPASAPAH